MLSFDYLEISLIHSSMAMAPVSDFLPLQNFHPSLSEISCLQKMFLQYYPNYVLIFQISSLKSALYIAVNICFALVSFTLFDTPKWCDKIVPEIASCSMIQWNEIEFFLLSFASDPTTNHSNLFLDAKGLPFLLDVISCGSNAFAKSAPMSNPISICAAWGNFSAITVRWYQLLMFSLAATSSISTGISSLVQIGVRLNHISLYHQQCYLKLLHQIQLLTSYSILH